jgi:hypothetical protein
MAPPPFLPVRLTSRPSSAGLELEFMVGPDRSLRLRGPVDAAWLVHVIRGLEGAGC